MVHDRSTEEVRRQLRSGDLVETHLVRKGVRIARGPLSSGCGASMARRCLEVSHQQHLRGRLDVRSELVRVDGRGAREVVFASRIPVPSGQN